ncbi:major egg antigen [Plakobranchus ocellatus]|uniref:Major egg antigen n=1 Tax=Plakobranchus ocellatus TaxID=259542 RepID=A0AAV4CT15_9GAST|nr:major egg antigen [Plakobranchus ocellatus]
MLTETAPRTTRTRTTNVGLEMNYSCICGRRFATERGMEIHRTKMECLSMSSQQQRTAIADKTLENQSQVQNHSAKEIQAETRDDVLRRPSSDKRQKINFPPASSGKQWEYLDSKIVLKIDSLLGKSTLEYKLATFGDIVYQTCLDTFGAKQHQIKCPPQRSRRHLEMDTLRKQKRKLKKQIRAASSEETNGLLVIWRQLKARHSALSRAQSARKKRSQKRKNQERFIKDPFQRKLWEDEFDRMRQEFFTLKPSEKPAPSQPLTSLNLETGMQSMFETDSDGVQRYRVRFDVSEFQPEEIQVKVQENKLIVNAKHEEKSAQTSVSREYSRQVDIPSTVDQETMQCVLSKDGVLTVEAPVSQPTITQAEPVFPATSSPQLKTLDVGTPVKNPIITEADGSRKLRLQVDIGDFKPEDVVVKTMDRKLIVHAEHEEKTSGRTLHKEFNKEYDLPESVDPATIQAYIADDRNLTIEAPLKPVQRKTYSVTQSQDVRKVTVTKESSVTIRDGQSRPVVTISVHRK